MTGDPRIFVLRQGYPVSALVDDIRASLSDSIVIDARSSDLLKNEADFRLVLHYTRDEGKTITVITRDPAVAALAAQLDVEVLSEIQRGQVVGPADGPAATDSLPDGEAGTDTEEPVRIQTESGSPDSVEPPDHVDGYTGEDGEDGHSSDRVSSPKTRVRASIVIAAIALVAVVAAVVCIFGMRVHVTAVPATLSVRETVIIAADPAGARSGEQGATLGITVPSEVLSVDVEYSTEISTTGERREGIAPSVGEVLFINSGPVPVKVPARTRLSTSGGIEFETVNDVEVGPKTIITRAGLKVGETDGTALVAAAACSPGSAGNVPALSITLIEESLSDRIQVINENEFRGGRDRVIRVVSESDVEQLREMSERSMLEEGADRLRKQAGLDRYLLLPTLELHVRSSRIYPDVSRESDRVSIDVKGTVDLESVHFDDLCAVIGDKLSMAMDDGFHLLTDSLQIDSLSCARLGSGTVAISVDVGALFVADVDERFVAAALSGEEPDKARRALLESGKIADLLFDTGLKRFPRWTQLIDVTVSEPAGVQVSQETGTGGV